MAAGYGPCRDCLDREAATPRESVCMYNGAPLCQADFTRRIRLAQQARAGWTQTPAGSHPCDCDDATG